MPFANSRACTLIAMLRSSFLRARNGGGTERDLSRIYVYVLCAFSRGTWPLLVRAAAASTADINPRCTRAAYTFHTYTGRKEWSRPSNFGYVNYARPLSNNCIPFNRCHAAGFNSTREIAPAANYRGVRLYGRELGPLISRAASLFYRRIFHRANVSVVMHARMRVA